MFRIEKRRRSIKKHNLLYRGLKSIQNRIIAFIFDIMQVIVYLGLNLSYLLNFLYKKNKAAITLFCHWVMQYQFVQFLVHEAKEAAFAIQQFCSFSSLKFKIFFVNTVPIRAFVWIARVLPIGDWLKYEEQDNFGMTYFLLAVEDKDFVLLERMLKVCSQEALYRYLFMKDWIGVEPLQYAFFHHKKDTTATEKILRIIPPEKRLWVLNNLTVDYGTTSSPLVFSLVCGGDREPHLIKVLELLPKKDRIHFMNQVTTGNGSSPLILKAFNGDKWEHIKGFLDYYPKEYLLDYLNIQNDRKETFLMAAVQYSSNDYTNNIIELVPESQRTTYLAKHNQGLKALLYAKSSSPDFYVYHHITVLEKYGIRMPEEYAHLSPQELKEQLPKIFEALDAKEVINDIEQSIRLSPNENTVRENFKLKHGAYPLEILQVDNEDASLGEIKTAYKKLMLFSHPDKNNDSEESTDKSKLINEAYGVYAKPDIRKSYYQIKKI